MVEADQGKGEQMKDAIGNELKPGDLVQLQLKTPLVFCRVQEVTEPSLVTGLRRGGEERRPGVLVLTANHTVLVGLGEHCAVVLLVDPTRPEQEQPKIEALN
jgi:hypothetical protein